jgi:hypothetical protein
MELFTARGCGDELGQAEIFEGVAMGSRSFETNFRCRGHAGAVEHALSLDVSC